MLPISAIDELGMSWYIACKDLREKEYGKHLLIICKKNKHGLYLENIMYFQNPVLKKVCEECQF